MNNKSISEVNAVCPRTKEQSARYLVDVVTVHLLCSELSLFVKCPVSTAFKRHALVLQELPALLFLLLRLQDCSASGISASLLFHVCCDTLSPQRCASIVIPTLPW